MGLHGINNGSCSRQSRSQCRVVEWHGFVRVFFLSSCSQQPGNGATSKHLHTCIFFVSPHGNRYLPTIDVGLLHEHDGVVVLVFDDSSGIILIFSGSCGRQLQEAFVASRSRFLVFVRRRGVALDFTFISTHTQGTAQRGVVFLMQINLSQGRRKGVKQTLDSTTDPLFSRRHRESERKPSIGVGHTGCLGKLIEELVDDVFAVKGWKVCRVGSKCVRGSRFGWFHHGSIVQRQVSQGVDLGQILGICFYNVSQQVWWGFHLNGSVNDSPILRLLL
mmetsp:Transcript_5920/g.13779  ORF Transcript_5920/g.13779 Transcript_5920/m.13779 type:complete len:276 (-) Transcript_5920:1392-2219(-)